jgi:hypothetical protein
MAKEGINIWDSCWKLSLILYYFLGGLSSGLFLHIVWNNIIFKNPLQGRTTFYTNLVPAIIAIIGLAFFLFAKGFSLKGAFTVGRQFRKKEDKKAFLGMIFIIGAGLYAISDNLLVAYFTAMSALLFMLCQGVGCYRILFFTTYKSKMVPLLFVTTGMTAGYGFWLFLRFSIKGIPGSLWLPWGVMLILISLMVWGSFIWRNNAVMPITLLRQLRTRATLIAILDGVIPILALMGIYFSGFMAEISKTWVTRLSGCCGISLCLGGWIKLYLFLKTLLNNHPIIEIN